MTTTTIAMMTTGHDPSRISVSALRNRHKNFRPAKLAASHAWFDHGFTKRMTGNLFCALRCDLRGTEMKNARAFRESRTCSSSSQSKAVHNIRAISRIDANLSSRQILCLSFRVCKPPSVYLLRLVWTVKF